MHSTEKLAVDSAVYGHNIVLQVTIDSWKKRIIYAWKTLCGEVLFSTVRVKPEEFNLENPNNS